MLVTIGTSDRGAQELFREGLLFLLFLLFLGLLFEQFGILLVGIALLARLTVFMSNQAAFVFAFLAFGERLLAASLFLSGCPLGNEGVDKAGTAQ